MIMTLEPLLSVLLQVQNTQDADDFIMEQTKQTGCHVKMTREHKESPKTLEFFVETELPIAQLRISAWQNGVLVEAMQEAANGEVSRKSVAKVPCKRAKRHQQPSCSRRSPQKAVASKTCNGTWTFVSCRPLLSSDARLISFPGGVKVVVPVDAEAEASVQADWQAAFGKMA
jgi:hypothetical protein